MKTSSDDDRRLTPLLTDSDIENRARELIGRANQRQLWLLFLDRDGVQLPLLIPIDGLPLEPTEQEAESIVERLRELMERIEAVAVILVLERYGSDTLTAQDATWFRALAENCSSRGVDLRGLLLSHRAGVRWIKRDEYSLASAAGSAG
jgi:hypothetical protein